MSSWKDILSYDRIGLESLKKTSTSENDSRLFEYDARQIKPALFPLSASRKFNRKAANKPNYKCDYVYDNGLISWKDPDENEHSDRTGFSNSSADTSSTNSGPVLLIKYKKSDDKSNGANTDSGNAGGVTQDGSDTPGSHFQKKREVYSIFLFVFFLFVTVLTLSQILVFHNRIHSSNFGQIKLMQDELKLMDATIDTMLREKKVIPMQVWYALKQSNDNLKRFSGFIDDMSLSFVSDNNSFQIDANLYDNKNMTDRLNQCENFTNTLLNSFNSQNTDKPNMIYGILAKHIKSSETNSNSAIDTDFFTNEINIILKHSLKRITLLQGQLKDTNTKALQKSCLNAITVGLFSLFSQQYTRFVESQPKLGSLLLDRYDLVNKTLTKFHWDKSNDSESGYFLKMPLRNMRDFYQRYMKAQMKSTSNQTLCGPQPPDLVGPINVLDNHSLTMKSIENINPDVKVGGRGFPDSCQARHKLAIIIPYRDRYEHLTTLLSYLHPILHRQQLDYKIYVTEQVGNGTFNKAIIMNAAFIYAFDQDNYNCYCFHDVDLVPEDDRNMYSCGKNPKHMSIGVDEMNYKLQYEELIGGVLIMNTEHLIASNGYSNLYWGWGAEDDDLYYRLKALSYKVERPPLKIGRYKMMKHQKRKPQLWSKRAKLLYSSINRMTWDGISSANYTILKVTQHKLYTHLVIDVGEPPAGFN